MTEETASVPSSTLGRAEVKSTNASQPLRQRTVCR
jgi:hypothetical protein